MYFLTCNCIEIYTIPGTYSKLVDQFKYDPKNYNTFEIFHGLIYTNDKAFRSCIYKITCLDTVQFQKLDSLQVYNSGFTESTFENTKLLYIRQPKAIKKKQIFLMEVFPWEKATKTYMKACIRASFHESSGK